MRKESTPIAKSLHTVTAIVNVAAYVRKAEPMANAIAVRTACAILGLEGADPYGLADKALAQLNKRG